MKVISLLIASIICFSFLPLRQSNSKAWQGKPQMIPGRLDFELYDEGGEGIAYHDTDSSNNGSGKLNPADGTFLNVFRKNEGVDISYTKTGDVDDNHHNKVMPPMASLYVGWTMPGEWINYTVMVKETGTYTASLNYTANGDGHIRFDVDGKSATASLLIPTTHDDRDTVAWRQWHHWNRLEQVCTISLSKGTHVVRLNVVDNGNMNFDWMEFKKL